MSQRLVAEIVGPAGAGKSTLARALRRRDANLKTGLSVWGLPAPLLALNALLALPRFLSLYVSRRRMGLDELKLMIRLSALDQLLGRESSGNDRTILLDEGTIFALAKLVAFGNGNGVSARTDGWTQSLTRRWAGKVNTIIWLDASDEVLANRIRARSKTHRMKEKTDREIYQFLARYRNSYEEVIRELSARHNLRVIRFSTDRESLEQVADEVLARMSEGI